MHKLRVSLAALALAALGIATSSAVAGQRGSFGYTVYNSPNYNYAQGAFSDVRATPDIYSRVDCGTVGSVGMCMFIDTVGTYQSCYTTDPGNIAVIRSMQGDSFFSVTWDASGQCTSVLSYTTSVSNPKSH